MDNFSKNLLKKVFSAENSLYENDPIGNELGSLIFTAVQFKAAIRELENAMDACDSVSEEQQRLRRKMRGTKYAIENTLKDIEHLIDYLRDCQLSKSKDESNPVSEQVEKDIREFLEKGE